VKAQQHFRSHERICHCDLATTASEFKVRAANSDVVAGHTGGLGVCGRAQTRRNCVSSYSHATHPQREVCCFGPFRELTAAKIQTLS
jgi:hypothetical protein